jgi:hypothetical protein
VQPKNRFLAERTQSFNPQCSKGESCKKINARPLGRKPANKPSKSVTEMVRRGLRSIAVIPLYFQQIVLDHAWRDLINAGPALASRAVLSPEQGLPSSSASGTKIPAGPD